MKSFFVKLAAFVGLFFASACLTAANTTWGLWGSSAIALVSGIAVFKPLPQIGLQSRLYSVAIFLFIACIGLGVSISTIGKETAEKLALLKTNNPTEYLATLEKSDQNLWLSELKIMDPEGFKTASARVAAEKAEKLAAEAEVRMAELASKRAAECGAENATLAYIYSQQFVEQRLRAPSTADFPHVTSISARATGDCTFQINAYVDAQNGFGAMLRTPYGAVMKRLPEQESWQLVSLDFAE